jgi:flagellar biosynthesis protein FlhF
LPLFDVRSADDWRTLLRESQQFEKIFIDLPGLSREKNLEDWFTAKGFEMPEDAAVHLVLSPHYSSTCLQRFAKHFHVPSLASVVWTKLDEAESYGSMINLGYVTNLPVSALCYGPSLSACLAAAENQLLWKMIFTHRLPDKRRKADVR